MRVLAGVHRKNFILDAKCRLAPGFHFVGFRKGEANFLELRERARLPGGLFHLRFSFVISAGMKVSAINAMAIPNPRKSAFLLCPVTPAINLSPTNAATSVAGIIPAAVPARNFAGD